MISSIGINATIEKGMTFTYSPGMSLLRDGKSVAWPTHAARCIVLRSSQQPKK